jgi:hypothetical protein
MRFMIHLLWRESRRSYSSPPRSASRPSAAVGSVTLAPAGGRGGSERERARLALDLDPSLVRLGDVLDDGQP